MNRQRALILIGPTGSGKTPLGDWLAKHGFKGLNCHHFDFGFCLREIAAGRGGSFFSAEEVLFVRDLVKGGTLLENETFYLALRILEDFAARRGGLCEDWLVINGLPRHPGQAEALESTLQCGAVIDLQCTAETVRERLRCNSGGDRTHRIDDDLTLVERKLAIFAERTRPLLDYYQARGVPLIRIPVGIDTTPEAMHAIVERGWP